MPSEAGGAECVSSLSERELIARIHHRLPPSPDWLLVGIGDDAAVVEPARNRLEVLSVDAIVEGVHFDRAFTPPAAIGHRALAVNLSDLAAMGATPRLALLSLALPVTLTVAEFDEMMASLTALAARVRMSIVGGNLTRIDGPLVLDVTVAGTVKRRQTLTRTGARPGDDLYVTGSIGGAAAGLHMLRAGVPSGEASASCLQRYLYPEPRLQVGALLGRNRAATACMDLSDGLADAVRQLTGASGIGATIDEGAFQSNRAPDSGSQQGQAWSMRPSPAVTITNCCSPRGPDCAGAWQPPNVTATRPRRASARAGGPCRRPLPGAASIGPCRLIQPFPMIHLTADSCAAGWSPSTSKTLRSGQPPPSLLGVFFGFSPF